ncbi:YfhO family protein [Archangium minus]|uniref:YfhO family protein n=1 Tax=Archangium minus TaxID=83450 RepID=A0ABY9X6N4_9BACT|nr:YfhO family protein [Archangium minus]
MPLSQQAKTRISVVAIAFLAPLLYFHRATFSGDIFISRDILRVYYPLKKYWAERVSQLQFPDWYPYDGLGQPFTGMVISGAFHPANILYLLLPLGLALKVITLLSYVAALGGTYLFARLWGMGRGAALLSAFTYALCGYMVGISNNLLYLMAAATFPWALWGAERFLRQPSAGRAATAAIPLCLVLLCGDPQSFAVCNGLLLVLALLRPGRADMSRALPRAGVLIVLGALLSAVQLVPAFTVIREAAPNAGTLAKATAFSFHPLRLLELLLGPLFVDPEVGAVSSPSLANQVFDSGMGSLWVSSAHLGVTAFLLLLAALWTHLRHPMTWKVAGLALLFLVLTLGRNLPLYGWLYEWLPLWRSFRYPEKLLPYFLFLCALGVGAGLEAVQREPATRRRTLQLGLVLAALCGVLALGEGLFQVLSQGVIGSLWKRPEPFVLEYIHDNVIHLSWMAVGALLLSCLVLGGVEKPGLRAGLLAGVQLGSLYLANESTYHVSFAELLEQPVSTVNTLLQREPDTGAGRPRVMGAVEGLVPAEVPGVSPQDSAFFTLVAALEPDTPGLWHLESAIPYLPATSRRYGLVRTSSRDWWERVGGLFHVRYASVNARTFRGNPDSVVGGDRLLGVVLIQNPRTLPRAYLAMPLCASDERSARELLLSASFQPGRQVVLECPAAEPSGAPTEGELGQVSFLRYAPEHVELEVKAERPAVLVLNDAWYSGWSATLDGEPVSLLPANVAVRGVRVPAGTHRVLFTYRTPGRDVSVAISLGTLALLALATLASYRRRPANHSA